MIEGREIEWELTGMETHNPLRVIWAAPNEAAVNNSIQSHSFNQKQKLNFSFFFSWMKLMKLNEWK